MKNSPNKSKAAKMDKASATSSVGRITRSTTPDDPVNCSPESSSKSYDNKKPGYCQPTQSTLLRNAQVKAEEAQGTLASSGKDMTTSLVKLHKASYPLPKDKPIVTSLPSHKVALAPQKLPTASSRLVRKDASVSEAKPTVSTRLVSKDVFPASPKKHKGIAETLLKGSSFEHQKKPNTFFTNCGRASTDSNAEPTDSVLPDSEEASSNSSPHRKARPPNDSPVMSPTSKETRGDICPEPAVSTQVGSRDLGLGYLQYLTPQGLELFHEYQDSNAEERQAMIDRGEVDAKDMERTYILEHIFDHLPVPGKDFEPVKTETLPEMFLEPALRGLFLEEKNKKLELTYMDHQTFSFETRNRIVEMMAHKMHSACWRRDTFLLAVNLLDSALSKGQVRKNELVIYSLCCIFIATKLNQRDPIKIEELVADMAEIITEAKIEKAEMNLLNFLKFDVYCIPTHQFLNRIGFYDKFNKHVITLAKYFLEISQFGIALVTELPSKLAAACYALSRRILVTPEWTAGHHYYSGYALEELEPVIETITTTIERLPMDCNISIRYNSSRHMYASHTAFSIMRRDYNVVTGFKV